MSGESSSTSRPTLDGSEAIAAWATTPPIEWPTRTTGSDTALGDDLFDAVDPRRQRVAGQVDGVQRVASLGEHRRGGLPVPRPAEGAVDRDEPGHPGPAGSEWSSSTT